MGAVCHDTHRTQDVKVRGMPYLDVEGGEGDEGVVVDERAEGLVEFAKLLAERVGVESVQQVVQVAHIRKELQIERCV